MAQAIDMKRLHMGCGESLRRPLPVIGGVTRSSGGSLVNGPAANKPAVEHKTDQPEKR